MGAFSPHFFEARVRTRLKHRSEPAGAISFARRLPRIIFAHSGDPLFDASVGLKRLHGGWLIRKNPSFVGRNTTGAKNARQQG